MESGVNFKIIIPSDHRSSDNAFFSISQKYQIDFNYTLKCSSNRLGKSLQENRCLSKHGGIPAWWRVHHNRWRSLQRQSAWLVLPSLLPRHMYYIYSLYYPYRFLANKTSYILFQTFLFCEIPFWIMDFPVGKCHRKLHIKLFWLLHDHNGVFSSKYVNKMDGTRYVDLNDEDLSL